MKKYNIYVLALTVSMVSLSTLYVAIAATTPSIGMTTSYAILSSTYTNTSTTTVNGSIGFTTGPAVTPLGVHTQYGSGAPYSTAGTDQGALLSALNIQPCTFTFAPGAINLSTDTTHGTAGVYTPGVYCSSGAMNVGGPLMLNGGGTYIFRPSGALTTTAGAVITLSGASMCDVFWTPTQATTLGANTTFVGTIIDDAGITVGANSTVSGKLLSFGGTVTTNTNTITNPICVSNATLRVIKLVVGGTATSTDFSMYVKLGGVNVTGSPAFGTTTPGTSYSLVAGTYSVAEDISASYTQSFSGDCNASGSITLLPGDIKTCTVTNTNIPAVVVPPPVLTTNGGGYSSAVVPVIGLTKIPTPSSLPQGAGVVVYDYTVWNVSGQQRLSVTLTDNKCSTVVFLTGDINGNSKLDPTEIWKYRCTSSLSVTTTNIATAIGVSDDVYHQTTQAIAQATVVVGVPPVVTIIPLSAPIELALIPTLPNAGVAPDDESGSAGMSMLMLLSISMILVTSLAVISKKYLFK